MTLYIAYISFGLTVLLSMLSFHAAANWQDKRAAIFRGLGWLLMTLAIICGLLHIVFATQ